MTSRPVMDAGSFVSYASNTKITGGSDGSTGGFSRVMDQAVSTGKTKQTDPVKTDTGQRQTASEESAKAEPSKAEAAKKDNAKSDPAKSEEAGTEKAASKSEKAEAAEQNQKTEELEASMKEAAMKVMEGLAGILQMPVSDVQNMMAQLQMTQTDVLNPDSLKSLTLALTGSDETSLLTDEALLGTVGDALEMLTEVTDELQQTTGLSTEKLQKLLHNQSGDTESFADTLMRSTQNADTQESVNVQITETSAKPEKTTEGTTGSTDNAATAEKPENLTKEVQSDSGKQQTGDQHQFDQSSPVMTNSQSLTAANATVEEMAEVPFQMPSAQDIMEQITNYMKLTVKPEMSQLEMQLHPETLGTLHIQISSREGIMTAQFVTPSEDVKAVLESQLLDLRQNLENQGVKIEAVEVTVAEYSMDRSFSNEKGSEGEEASSQNRKSKGVNLNLQDMDWDEEELSVADRLTADLMKAGGNTVNYTV